ncbi:MAG TPA: DUF885 family protein [Acidobacteriota bacterium]|nr:DUF885 family protein [Acidobacteriota bacterium]
MFGRGVRDSHYCLVVVAAGLAVLLSLSSNLRAQEIRKPLVARESTPPDLAGVVESENRMRPIVMRFMADSRDLMRIYAIPASSERLERLAQFYTDWKAALQKLDFESLNVDARIDYILLSTKLDYELFQLENYKTKLDAALPLLPFAGPIINLMESRRRFEPLEPRIAAEAVDGIAKLIEEKQGELQKTREAGELEVSLETAMLATQTARELSGTLSDWFTYYDGYDPMFTWWVETPFADASATLEGYMKWLEETFETGADVERPVVGIPAGREFLVTELEAAFIPYTPEEIIAIGEAEYAWCINELKKASNELGYGDDWLKALEYVKTLHVEPGAQPQAVADMAFEAVNFLRDNDLITVDQLAVDSWNLEMMSLERQKFNPFFTGGADIDVSFPTDEMDHAGKLMSMRGNNIHFARATVHHELIPGHHMQFYTIPRNNSHRGWTFGTPFWSEGWALHWEMLLWDLGFPQTPENRIGMLFWRIHRAARIIFSFKFHLGLMTAQECIDMLIEGVGHEPSNAEAEVRRSFESHYNPIYQAAYMIGGLQFRALHRELVDSGRMSNREFHDAVLRNSVMPVEMVRAALTNQVLPRDFKSVWKFYGEVEVPAK